VPQTTSVEETVVPQTTSVEETVVPQTTSVEETVVPQTTSVEETVVPQTTSVEETVVPQTTSVEETVVPQTTSVEKTVVPQTTSVEERLVLQSVISENIIEEITEKTVEKEVVTISRRNNQPQSEQVVLYNPSLRLIPCHEPADVISAQRDSSLVDWLEASGKMLPRDPYESEKYTEEEEEISELIAVDDNFHDDDILDENAEDSSD
jgi:hypothetical protein